MSKKIWEKCQKLEWASDRYRKRWQRTETEWKRIENMPNVTKSSAFGCVVFLLTYFFLFIVWFCLKCSEEKEQQFILPESSKNCGITPESKKRLHIRIASASSAAAGRFANTFARRCVLPRPVPGQVMPACYTLPACSCYATRLCVCVYNELSVKKKNEQQNCLLINRSSYRNSNSTQL